MLVSLRWTLGIVVGVAACSAKVPEDELPVSPAPFEGTVNVPGFPGTANVEVELRGQFASFEPCDLDGDGLDDLVLVANHAGASLHLVHGREELLHRAVAVDDIGTSMPIDGEARLQCLGDLDGDGAEEVALCGHLADRTMCRVARLGEGSALAYALELDLGPEAHPEYPTAQAIDLDADGRLDLFVDVPLWDDPVRFFLSDVAAELDAHAAPLDAEAIPHGVESVAVERPHTDGYLRDVHIADLDNDGALERLAAFCHGPDGNCAMSDVLIGSHQDSDVLPPVPADSVWAGIGPRIFAVQDVDGDGILDLLTEQDGALMLAFGPLDYAQPLLEQAAYLTNGPEAVLLGDIDGDGSIDAAARSDLEDGAGSGIEVFALTRDPTPFATFSIGGQMSVGPAGDFNGDGHDDFIVWDTAALHLVYGHPR